MSKIQEYKDRLLEIWNNLLNRVDEGDVRGFPREKIFVFIVAFVLALCLWLLVNLNRDFNLTLNMPVALGNIPDNQALAEELPDFITVNVQGEGWKLINLYNSPPRIFIDVTQTEINLFDQVQQQMNALPEINVQKVQPLIMNINLEKKVSKQIPVMPNVAVNFREQYDFVGEPVMVPDSIPVSGAASVVDNIVQWGTESVELNDVRRDIAIPVKLQEPGGLVTISPRGVEFRARVSEYTEGEARVFVRIRNLPNNRDVSFSPSQITVRYLVPIDEYNEIQKLNPFTAYIDYRQILGDSTGFVQPRLDVSAGTFNLKVRGFQPREVAYFMVVGN